jgi:hypothetical protein
LPGTGSQKSAPECIYYVEPQYSGLLRMGAALLRAAAGNKAFDLDVAAFDL